MTARPLLEKPARVTEDFGSQTSVAFSGDSLVGACPADGESYVMRWPHLPGPYEPLIVLPGRAVEIAGAPDGRALAVSSAHGEDDHPALSLTFLDLLASRRGDLVRPEDGLKLGQPRPAMLWSPDGRFLAVAGARAETKQEGLTLVFAVTDDTPHRWMLSGHGTRWDGERLILLEEHGVSAWSPGHGTEFLGDAPVRTSPDGRWTLLVTEDGLELRGPDSIERQVQLDEEHREVMGWLDAGRVVLGYEEPIVLELATLATRPLAAQGLVCRAVGPDGRVALADEDWLYAGHLSARG